MTEQRTILGIYAHPDDEILSLGGTLARYAAAGHNVVLVMATRGEAGEIQRPGTATPETLPQVREQEMKCSAQTLGVSELIFLDYRDSGMEGTPENEDPRAFVNAPAHEVVEKLVNILRHLRPDIILTFEPYGGYGHPDHIAVNRYSLAAFDAAADANRYQAQGPAWQVQRLFYPVLPTFLFEEMKRRVAARGGDVNGYDEIIEGRPRQDSWPDDSIDVTLDVSPFIDKKWQAWHCHQTQFGPDSRFRRLPEDEMKELLSKEFFVLARPAAGEDTDLEELLSGLE